MVPLMPPDVMGRPEVLGRSDLLGRSEPRSSEVAEEQPTLSALLRGEVAVVELVAVARYIGNSLGSSHPSQIPTPNPNQGAHAQG